MQSNISKILVAIGSVIAIVALFVVFSDEDRSGSNESAVTETPPASSSGGDDDAAGDPEKKQKNEGGPADEKQQVPVIVVKGGQPAGGVQELEFAKSDEIRFRVESDVDDEVHVHGYDVSKPVKAGQTAELAFPAEIDGVYEVELEQSAVPIAELTVNP